MADEPREAEDKTQEVPLVEDKSREDPRDSASSHAKEDHDEVVNDDKDKDKKKKKKKEHRHKDSRRSRSRSSSRHRRKRSHSSHRRRRSRSHERRRRSSRSPDRRRRSRSPHERRRRSRSSERRRRSRSPEERRRKSRSHERRTSPATTRMREEQTKQQMEPEKPKKFWDGFQWVEPQASMEHVSDTALHNISQQTRHERRLYVGNLLPTVKPQEIEDFLNTCMDTCLQGSGIVLPEGYNKSVISVWIGPSTNYAFVEFVTKECASIAMGLSGIEFQGNQLKISRPNNYGSTSNPYASQVPNQITTSALLAAALGDAPNVNIYEALPPSM